MSIETMRTAREGAAITLSVCRKHRLDDERYGFQLVRRAALMAAEGAAVALNRGAVGYAQLRAAEWRLLDERAERLYAAWQRDLTARCAVLASAA